MPIFKISGNRDQYGHWTESEIHLIEAPTSDLAVAIATGALDGAYDTHPSTAPNPPPGTKTIAWNALYATETRYRNMELLVDTRTTDQTTTSEAGLKGVSVEEVDDEEARFLRGENEPPFYPVVSGSIEARDVKAYLKTFGINLSVQEAETLMLSKAGDIQTAMEGAGLGICKITAMAAQSLVDRPPPEADPS